MEYIVGYRIVEVKNNNVLSLFHTTNGSRVIPQNQWNKAKSAIVKDGINGTPYLSGWHFLSTKQDADNFLERMFRIKKNRRVIKCYLRGNIREKQHSTKGGCLLADEILIKSDDLME